MTLANRIPRKAFTLIELLIVMIVIALLSLIVVPQFVNRSTQAREANLRDNLKTYRTALETWRTDTGAFPASLDQLFVTTAPTGVTGWSGPYLSSPMTQDPTTPPEPGSNRNWNYTAATGAFASANASYSGW